MPYYSIERVHHALIAWSESTTRQFAVLKSLRKSRKRIPNISLAINDFQFTAGDRQPMIRRY